MENQPSLTTIAYEKIKEQILNQALLPGSAIGEIELAKQMCIRDRVNTVCHGNYRNHCICFLRGHGSY